MEITGLTHVDNGINPCLQSRWLILPVLWKTDARTFSQEREGTFGENKKGNSKKDIFKLPDIHNALFVYLASFMTPSM